MLQVADGHAAIGELQLISRTGGLLWLSTPVKKGSVVELEFQTHKGPVLGKPKCCARLQIRSSPSALLH